MEGMEGVYGYLNLQPLSGSLSALGSSSGRKEVMPGARCNPFALLAQTRAIVVRKESHLPPKSASLASSKTASPDPAITMTPPPPPTGRLFELKATDKNPRKVHYYCCSSRALETTDISRMPLLPTYCANRLILSHKGHTK